ncbi:MAG: sigma 54-interacting transcriptional regulator [Bacteroidales bacterium]
MIAPIIAATNKDLAAKTKAGNFRRDLCYRLAVTELQLPKLLDE